MIHQTSRKQATVCKSQHQSDLSNAVKRINQLRAMLSKSLVLHKVVLHKCSFRLMWIHFLLFGFYNLYRWCFSGKCAKELACTHGTCSSEAVLVWNAVSGAPIPVPRATTSWIMATQPSKYFWKRSMIAYLGRRSGSLLYRASQFFVVRAGCAPSAWSLHRE